MERYMSEGPGKQHAMVIVETCGHISMSKGCTCNAVGQMLEISEDEKDLVSGETKAGGSEITARVREETKRMLILTIKKEVIDAKPVFGQPVLVFDRFDLVIMPDSGRLNTMSVAL